MNEAERERLIKKDIASIENRVRHAFNQGYEMGMKDREKLNCTDCIIEKSDDFIKSHTAMMMAKDALSRSEIPNTCGDAVSRAIVQEEITKSIELKENPYQLWYRIRALPSVTPQQRTGRWIEGYEWVCSNCGTLNRALYKCCSHCGKMEVKE